MELSIIIVNFHNSHTLGKCLDSIPQGVRNIDYEILLVNNSPRDDGLANAVKDHPLVRRIENLTNLGFAKANNQAFDLSKGKTILFLNPDTVLTDNSIDNMLNYLHRHAEIGLLGAKLLDPDGKLQYSCRRFPTLWTGLFNRYSIMTRLFPGNPFTRQYLMLDFDHNSAREVDWVSGSCMMISRELFLSIGKFDEGYFLFNEDVDLCHRMKEAGKQVVYFPDAQVFHHISSSNSKLAAKTIIRRHLGMVHYYKKNRRPSAWALFLIKSLVALRCTLHLVLNSYKQGETK
jgi:GT2 family glycosyltransferase